jgi:tetratricopeptide (TPR) repeat protein
MKTLIIAILIAFSFSVIFSANAESVDELHDKAYQFMKSGNFSDAIDTYSKILEIQPNDEETLLNRAIAYTHAEEWEIKPANVGMRLITHDGSVPHYPHQDIKEDRFDKAIRDLDSVLLLNPSNNNALNKKAFILVKLDCISYKKCGPLESLRILEQMLESDPNNSELENQRNFVLTNVPPFTPKETDSDYIVRFLYVLRNSEGSLVSVTDGFTSRVIPTKLLEEYLDREKITNIQNLEKEIVSIEGEEYVKWYFEIPGIENERTMIGKWKMHGKIGIEDIKKQYRVAEIELAGVMTPGIVTDKGDHSLVIVEILKKI